MSKRVAVPIVAAPSPAPQPTVTYDESKITVAWGSAPVAAEATADDSLPSHSLLGTPSRTAYNVYEVIPQASGGARAEETKKLTATPVAQPPFVDARIDWGAERCYAVRTVEIIDALPVEGDRGPSRCVTLVDTFPPAAPKKPTAIGLVGAINILWDAAERGELIWS